MASVLTELVLRRLLVHLVQDIAELLGLMVNEPNVEPNELKRIQSPTLVIAGDKDMIKDSHTHLIAAQIPKSELQIIPGNHFIANKNPEMFNEMVLRFLVR